LAQDYTRASPPSPSACPQRPRKTRIAKSPDVSIKAFNLAVHYGAERQIRADKPQNYSALPLFKTSRSFGQTKRSFSLHTASTTSGWRLKTKNRPSGRFLQFGGEGGIRTLEITH